MGHGDAQARSRARVGVPTRHERVVERRGRLRAAERLGELVGVAPAGLGHRVAPAAAAAHGPRRPA